VTVTIIEIPSKYYFEAEDHWHSVKAVQRKVANIWAVISGIKIGILTLPNRAGGKAWGKALITAVITSARSNIPTFSNTSELCYPKHYPFCCCTGIHDLGSSVHPVQAYWMARNDTSLCHTALIHWYTALCASMSTPSSRSCHGQTTRENVSLEQGIKRKWSMKVNRRQRTLTQSRFSLTPPDWNIGFCLQTSPWEYVELYHE
jgi:hypothetical protein